MSTTNPTRLTHGRTAPPPATTYGPHIAGLFPRPAGPFPRPMGTFSPVLGAPAGGCARRGTQHLHRGATRTHQGENGA
ncbi:hypothetical protein ACMA1D_08785 [Streptomyces sp. 796.1]|uniref:hypothetical protein n=1 Tax=Streptomyces sp. 796.1 TaxID=3163029 RepID=UPI0039C8C1B6